MSVYERIINRFPSGIVYSFAYGSGVKKQLGYGDIDQKQKVIDLTLCVENTFDWHADNLKQHPSHYSGIRLFGSKFIASYQEKLGASVYFNTLVPIDDLGVTIKYGVISTKHLEKDLKDWDYLYYAGRLHKPVTDVIPPADEKLRNHILLNLESAFMVALLMLPERFTEFELFHTISNISYKGDFRMIFGENKNKVKNIVEAQLDDFFLLYHPVLQRLSQFVAMGFEKSRETKYFEQDKSAKTTEYYLKRLPTTLQRRIRSNSVFKGNYLDVVHSIAAVSNLPDLISMSLKDIVWRSSMSQSVKNIPTAGLTKSIIYSYRKALKTFN